MKLFISLFLSAFIVSTTFAQEVSVCADEIALPCELTQEAAKTAFLDMMLANSKGLELLNKTGRNGLTLPFLEEGVLKVTVLSETQLDTQFETKIKYELSLTDCRGTDSCGGSYLWTAVETILTDGYISQISYVNSIQKL